MIRVYTNLSKMVKCRTCLGTFSRTCGINITKEFMLGKSIKEILLPFVPQMITSTVDDLVCGKCVQQIKNFAIFVEKCIKTEKTLAENIKKDTLCVVPTVKGNQNTTPTVPLQLVYLLPTNHSGAQNGAQPAPFIQLQPMPMPFVVTPTKPNANARITAAALPSIAPTIASTPNQLLFIPSMQNNVVQAKQPAPTHPTSYNGNQIVDLTRKEVKKKTCQTCNSVFTPGTKSTRECSKCVEKERINSISDASSVDLNNDVESNDSEMATETKSPAAKIQPYTNDSLIGMKEEMLEGLVISATQTQDEVKRFLKTLSNSKLKVFEYGPLTSGKQRRILLLGDVSIKCPDCDFVLQNKKLFKLHMRYIHSDPSLSDAESNDDEYDNMFEDEGKTFECPFCQLKVASAMSLVQHLHEKHTIDEPFKCEKCGMKFDKRMKYLTHMKKFQNSTDCTVKKCYICLEEVSKIDYEEHLKNHKDIVCDQCGQSFVNNPSFKRHYATHGAIVKKKRNRSGKHELCSICGLLCTASAFRHHLKTHTIRPRNYMCHMCPKRFMSELYLRNHFKAAHSGNRYECNICNIKVKTVAALANHHRLKHSGTYTYTCQVCNTGFCRSDYFKRHLLSHENRERRVRKKYNFSVALESKPVKCKYCLKVCKNVYILRTHLLGHVKIKRYKCKFCNMTFANLSTRHRHQKRHADPNFNLSCKVCWKRMANMEELERHMAKHNRYKKYKCTVCGELVSSKYLLTHHMSERHIEQEEIEKETQVVLANALEEFLL